MSLSNDRATRDLLANAGKIAALVAALWAMSVMAADHVMAPHIAAAKAKARIMCELAKYVTSSAERTCEAVGSPCPRPRALEVEVIDSSCEEP